MSLRPRLPLMVAAVAALLVCSGPSHAQSKARADEAVAALKRNDCPAALAALKQGMLDNEPMSFLIAGNLAETGTCAAADPASAAKAYERAALLGRADAASALAMLYAQGSGVPQNYAEAARWYAIAANGGNAQGAPDASTYGTPDTIARTYVRAVHDLAYFSLANRLKYPYPIGARVRFDPRTSTATVVDRTPSSTAKALPDSEILASYKDAVADLPKPPIPASGDFATVRAMGEPGS